MRPAAISGRSSADDRQSSTLNQRLAHARRRQFLSDQIRFFNSINRRRARLSTSHGTDELDFELRYHHLQLAGRPIIKGIISMGDSKTPANQGKSYDADRAVLDGREKAYQDALGDGLEIVLGDGAETLADIAEGLNAHNVHGPQGQRWTEEQLETELERLGR